MIGIDASTPPDSDSHAIFGFLPLLRCRLERKAAMDACKKPYHKGASCFSPLWPPLSARLYQSASLPSSLLTEIRFAN